MKTLEGVKQGHDEYAAKTSGLHMQMMAFETYFGLRLTHLVFSATDHFSTNLQSENIIIQEATRGADLLVSHLKTLRTDERFDHFYEQVVSESSLLTEEPILPRTRKLPKQYDQGETPHKYPTPKDRYRNAYLEAIELAYSEIERRFEQSDLAQIKDLETLLLSAANGKDIESLYERVTAHLGDDLDCNRLKIQLLMVPDMIKTAFSSEQPVKEVTSVRTIANAMKRSSIYKEMLCEIDKILKIYLTYSVTSATSKRSFSSLKTYLRNSMSHSRLNNLFLLYVHSSRTDVLDLVTVAREFTSSNSRRLRYFGHF